MSWGGGGRGPWHIARVCGALPPGTLPLFGVAEIARIGPVWFRNSSISGARRHMFWGVSRDSCFGRRFGFRFEFVLGSAMPSDSLKYVFCSGGCYCALYVEYRWQPVTLRVQQDTKKNMFFCNVKNASRSQLDKETIII